MKKSPPHETARVSAGQPRAAMASLNEHARITDAAMTVLAVPLGEISDSQFAEYLALLRSFDTFGAMQLQSVARAMVGSGLLSPSPSAGQEVPTRTLPPSKGARRGAMAVSNRATAAESSA